MVEQGREVRRRVAAEAGEVRIHVWLNGSRAQVGGWEFQEVARADGGRGGDHTPVGDEGYAVGYRAAILDEYPGASELGATDDEEVGGEARPDGPQEVVEVSSPQGEVARRGGEGGAPGGRHRPAGHLSRDGGGAGETARQI